ncbi:HAUS augmin-like complex subunit 6 [Festucalex cinctus]
MANQTQKRNGIYLWFTLLGLGFEPQKHQNLIKTASKHTNLGPNMFDKPNKDAFHIVVQFLLEKLNPTRFQQTFKFCLPSYNSKQDAEFRKQTCAWLREIMVETGFPGSKVLASSLLSPGGPKFISLMVHLATQVMLKEMKTFATDESCVLDAVTKPTSSYGMAVNRLHLIKKNFLKEVAHQDRVFLEEQELTQNIVNSLQDLTAESKKYDELLKCHADDSVQEYSDDKPETVRSLWAAVDGMLSTTEPDRKVLESVLEGEVDQYVVDGTGRRLQIPRRLLDRMEQPPQQLSSGKAYEGGQLNLLCPLEVMNHALRLLKEEPRGSLPRLNLLQLQQKQQQVACQLQELELLRLKISKEEIPEVMSGIGELEAESDSKWADTSLVPLVNDDPALDFLSPMARLSFGAAVDASNASCVFSQFPAKLPVTSNGNCCPLELGCNVACGSCQLPEKSSECHPVEGESNISSDLKSCCPAAEEDLQEAAAAKPSRLNSSLDWLLDMPPCHQESSPEPPQATVGATSRSKATTKTILDMECDNLADQFADAVITTSPTAGRPAALELEEMLSILHADPFGARKQLPRTPESLILDVKSSWQKALEEDDSEKCDKSVFRCFTPLLEPCSEVAHQPGGSSSGAAKNRSIWGTFDTAASFSLQQETLPELPSCNSLLSLHSDEEEGLNSGCIQQQRGGGSPESLQLARDVLAASSERPSPVVFSLDFEALEKISPLKKHECLPPLIMFSPTEP